MASGALALQRLVVRVEDPHFSAADVLSICRAGAPRLPS
jgi:hypothetical protein